MSTFKIHPSIGIARLGDSPTEFYLCPDEAGVLPIECTPDGKPVVGPDGQEQRITNFKDAQNRIKRQAARFRLYVYDDKAPRGRELQLGEEITFTNRKSGQVIVGTVLDVIWTVHLANKKAIWYEFKETSGEHGYGKKHPLRNADITDDTVRQGLIIDPGPQSLNTDPKKVQSAEFARGQNPSGPQTFPPPLQPNSIDTLGGMKVYAQGKSSRLIVLGGFGNSGSCRQGLGEPSIQTYANNDGWFDDTSDGPVTAQIKYKPKTVDGRTPIQPGPTLVNVEDAAWCIVGYPRYAPEIVDIITMDDLVFDVAVRQFGFRPEIFGNGQPPPPATDAAALQTWRNTATWNQSFRPYFWRDIWPILSRPQYYNYITDPGQMFGGDPHNATPGSNGNLDPEQLSVPPPATNPPDPDTIRRAGQRAFIYGILRKPGQENDFKVPNPRSQTLQFIGMPYLCGDNPLSNTAASKFLRLTDTQLFLMKQWADGKFINERDEKIDVSLPPGEALDRGALATMLGGAFCPGAEACWIMRNPAIYAQAYRLNLSADYKPHAASQNFVPGSLSLTGNLSTGLEPGDITKYSALPWQADFNECSTQDINLTYRDWNKTPLESIGDPAKKFTQTTYWWPSHRPMWVFANNYPGAVFWSKGAPQTNEGDLAMVTLWTKLGFLKLAGKRDGENSAFDLVEAQNQ